MKPVPGFEEYFVIDESCNIFSLRREKKISYKIDDDGYYQAVFRIKGKRYYKRVHRLFALAYIPNPLNLPCVNHIDGNKLNNSISNLEWCTIGDNIRHYIRLKKKEIIRTV